MPERLQQRIADAIAADADRPQRLSRPAGVSTVAPTDRRHAARGARSGTTGSAWSSSCPVDPRRSSPSSSGTSEGRCARSTRSAGRAERSPCVTDRRRLGRWPSGSPSGSRGREPFAESYHYASLAARLRRAHRRGRGAGRRGDRAAVARRARPGPGSPTAPAGCAPTSRRSSACCARSPTARRAHRRPVALAPRRAARSPAPRSACCSAGCRRRVLGQYDLLVVEDENPEDQDLVYYVGPERPRPREALRVPAPRVPAVAGAARGHPPGPVHRRARGCASTSSSLVEQTLDAVDPDPKRFLDALGRVADELRAGPQPARRRRPRGAARQPRAARGARPGQRADEPARGPRRRHHGPRRRRPHPERRALRPGAAPAAPAAQPGWPSCCSSSSASRPR